MADNRAGGVTGGVRRPKRLLQYAAEPRMVTDLAYPITLRQTARVVVTGQIVDGKVEGCFTGWVSSADAHPERFAVLALVCSLGGADALIRVLGPLPADLPAAVVALQHLDPGQASALPARLAAATSLRVRVAVDGVQLQPGVVDVAPPGRHLLLAHDDRLLMVNSLTRPSPRPSADLLLVSMAAVLGDRLLAVVLTGTGDDGAVGVQVVSRYGGRTLVQDEATSKAYAMPAAALAADSPDLPIALDDLAAAITTILRPVG